MKWQIFYRLIEILSFYEFLRPVMNSRLDASGFSDIQYSFRAKFPIHYGAWTDRKGRIDRKLRLDNQVKESQYLFLQDYISSTPLLAWKGF